MILQDIHNCPYYTGEDEDSETFNNLPKVTELVKVGLGFELSKVWFLRSWNAILLAQSLSNLQSWNLNTAIFS